MYLIQAILEYLNEDTSQKAVAKKYGVSQSSFQTWIRKYESEGADGLKPSTTYKRYSKEIKYSAVLDYLNGTTSQEEICKKYRISSNEDKKYASLIDFLKENEEKLKVFLSADEKNERLPLQPKG